MVGPPERVGDCARALAARVPAEQLRDLHYILRTAAARSRHGLRSVARVMALHDLQNAHGMLERRIGLWQASNPIRTHVACVFPGARLQAIRAGSWIETREQSTVVLVAVLISDERCCISVVDDVLLEVALVLQNVADDAAEKRDVRPCADLHE